MPDPLSFGKLDFKLVSAMGPEDSRQTAGTPFRIAVLGDFTGRTNRGAKDPAALSFKMVDRDNLEDLMARLNIHLELDLTGDAGTAIRIEIKELDDFHPDRLFQQVALFQELRAKRERLEDPQAFAQTVADLKGTETKATRAPEPGDRKPDGLLVSGNLLDQIIDTTEDIKQSASPSDTSKWGRFFQKIVAPHIVPGDDAKKEKMIAAVDRSVAALMNQILHHPDFQALEAAWRALKLLTYRLETGDRLAIYLGDLSQAELLADLNPSDDLATTTIYKKLVAEATDTPGAEPWSLVMGNYTFPPDKENAELLGRMAKIANCAGAPFIAAGHAHVLGCKSLARTPDPDDWQLRLKEENQAAWKQLRELPEAGHIGLALPRFILRLPYGEKTDPIDCFDLEEMDETVPHENYLWGNPAFACACLMGLTFMDYGWHFDQGHVQDLNNLPLHTYKKADTLYNKPCAETLFSQRAVDRIMEAGLMPLIAYKNQDHIRIARFQALSATPTALNGRWQT